MGKAQNLFKELNWRMLRTFRDDLHILGMTVTVQSASVRMVTTCRLVLYLNSFSLEENLGLGYLQARVQDNQTLFVV